MTLEEIYQSELEGFNEYYSKFKPKTRLEIHYYNEEKSYIKMLELALKGELEK